MEIPVGVNTAEYVCLLRSSHFISCRECSGPKKFCPNQSRNNSCSVPDANNLVFPNGYMKFKVNATSEIGSVTSPPDGRDIFNLSKILNSQFSFRRVSNIIQFALHVCCWLVYVCVSVFLIMTGRC